jgi:translation initiation factor 1
VPAAATGGKGIRVRLEKRPGGRSITVVLGLQGGEDALLALARDLRAACGAGGTLRDGVVELQGDQVDKARAFLAARGLKAR